MWSKILKELRNKLLLSQMEMADLLGVSFQSVNRWENNKNETTIKVKRKIRELCINNGIDLNAFKED